MLWQGSMPECVEQEQLETVAFSRKKFLNLPLRRYQKVQGTVPSSQAEFLFGSLQQGPVLIFAVDCLLVFLVSIWIITFYLSFLVPFWLCLFRLYVSSISGCINEADKIPQGDWSALHLFLALQRSYHSLQHNSITVSQWAHSEVFFFLF